MTECSREACGGVNDYYKTASMPPSEQSLSEYPLCAVTVRRLDDRFGFTAVARRSKLPLARTVRLSGS